MNEKLATHETLELHGLLAFKTLCAVKTKTMMPLVSCNELKSLMQEDLNTTTRHIKELETILKKSTTMTM